MRGEGPDPLDANLVVADVSRTSKTICLAVSPALKSFGLGSRARLFEVEERVGVLNEQRRLRAPGHRLAGSSVSAAQLQADPRLGIEYIAAKPRMSYYLDTSAKIYGIYLNYASKEDIHVYSVDEVFIDVTKYLKYFGCSAHELARRIVADILEQTGITATAGIGANLYLAKVAMDIVAKHIPADEDGVRIAELDERRYRELLWSPASHRFLEGGPWHSPQIGAAGNHDHGRHCTVFVGKGRRILQRGSALQVLRRECGNAHRPCLGLGAMHNRRY